jgi:hypothetical protein
VKADGQRKSSAEDVLAFLAAGLRYGDIAIDGPEKGGDGGPTFKSTRKTECTTQVMCFETEPLIRFKVKLSTPGGTEFLISGCDRGDGMEEIALMELYVQEYPEYEDQFGTEEMTETEHFAQFKDDTFEGMELDFKMTLAYKPFTFLLSCELRDCGGRQIHIDNLYQRKMCKLKIELQKRGTDLHGTGEVFPVFYLPAST